MSQYQTRLITEGIRIIEKDTPADSFNADYSNLNVEKAVSKRTQLAELRYQTLPVFEHFQYLIKLFSGLMALLFLLIGATSVSHFLVNQNGDEINFFWGIVLFIAPNLLSVLIWLFLYFKQNALNTSWVVNLSLSAISLIDKIHHKMNAKHPHYLALFQFYFEHRFSGSLGRAQLSFISHLWWSAYLLGATLSLLVVLATHQVDFIWQTTILSEDVFRQLTHILSAIPELLNIDVPNAVDVSNASIGASHTLPSAQESRISWSNLLIFSLTVYALLPRLLLALFFKKQIKRKKAQFTLDFSSPYYVQLKSLLHPISNNHFIDDPDIDTETSSSNAQQEKRFNNVLEMPKHAYPVAIELNEQVLQQATQEMAKYYSVNLINVVDSQSQQMALSEMRLAKALNIVLYVDVTRLPDRGWLSLVKKCHYQKEVSVYLVLLDKPMMLSCSAPSKRLQDWLNMAEQAGISLQRITYISHLGNTVKLDKEVLNG